MNLKDCYIKFGGDFDEVLGRLRREETVQKFAFKFLDDKSFSLFESSIGSKDYEDALEGAGPKLKELILERAAQDHSIDFVELKRLVDRAYPEQA